MMTAVDHIKMHMQEQKLSVREVSKRSERSAGWLHAALEGRKSITFEFAERMANSFELDSIARRALYLTVAREQLPEDVFNALFPDCVHKVV